MFPASFHSTGWHRPDFGGEIELNPARADDFSGAQYGQDCAFERAISGTWDRAERAHERRKVCEGQRWMVLHHLYFLTSGEKLL
jgi:hypothetical protein